MTVTMEMPLLVNKQEDLLNALREDNFEEFENILECHRQLIEIDHIYEDADGRTLLDIACSSTNRARYVPFLIEKGATVNLINKEHGAAPIHFAVLHSDEATVRLLVEHQDTDINLKTGEGKIALQLAGQEKKKEFIEILQKRHIHEKKQAKREILTTYYTPHDKTDDGTNPIAPPKKIDPFMEGDILFELLFQNDFQAFKSVASEDSVKCESRDFKWTYLQYACRLGRFEFVELLLDLNVDPNEMAVVDSNEDSYHRTPIVIAGFFGFYKIVNLLIGTHRIEYDHTPPYEHNILNSIIDGFARWQRYSDQSKETKKSHHSNSDDRDHLKCLELVLEKVPEYLCSADMKDSNHFTPLGCTGGVNNPEIVRCLLESGAYIGGQCSKNSLAIQHMRTDTLRYLLKKSTAIGIDPSTRRYNVKFNYNFLSCSNYIQKTHHKYINETKPLIALGENPLLKHAIFMVFLDFKWHLIMRKYFYINLAFYIQFVAILSFYLLTLLYVKLGSQIFANNPSAAVIRCIILIENIFLIIIRLFLDTTCLFNIIKNKSPIYFAVLENWIERILIVIIFIILTVKIESPEKRAQIAAAAIILSYVYLLLLGLSHPRMSKDFIMFKIVVFNSCKFLKNYLILIIAFAFSYYLLFGEATMANEFSKVTSSNNKSDADSFKNPARAVFKTMVMSMGEYNLAKMADTEFSINHLIILIFIFIVPIVLFNLLNAMAVNDIRGIEDNAELLSIVSRARTIGRMEQTITKCFSLSNRLANFYKVRVGKEPIAEEDDCLQKRYYLCNYFGVTSNSREITFAGSSGRCTIKKHYGNKEITFFPLPSTVRAIQRMTGDATVDSYDSTERVTQDAATLQQLNTNPVILNKDPELEPEPVAGCSKSPNF